MWGSLEQAIGIVREQRRHYPRRSDYYRVCTVILNKLQDAMQQEAEKEDRHWDRMERESLAKKFIRITR